MKLNVLLRFWTKRTLGSATSTCSFLNGESETKRDRQQRWLCEVRRSVEFCLITAFTKVGTFTTGLLGALRASNRTLVGSAVSGVGAQ